MKTINHPHGFFVDYNGAIHSTEHPRKGTYFLFEQLPNFVNILECSSENHEVIGEFVWYTSKEAIQEVIKGVNYV